MPCPCRLRSCFRGSAGRLEGHDGKQPRILGIGEINAESPSSFGSPRRDRQLCLQWSLRFFLGRSEAGRMPEQLAGAACASKPQGSRRFVFESLAPPPSRSYSLASAFASVARPGRRPWPSPNAEAIRRGGAGRLPIYRRPFINLAVGAPFFISASGCRFAPTTNARFSVSKAPWGSCRRLSGGNSNDGSIDPRMLRPSPAAFRFGGAAKTRLGPNLAQAPPPSQPNPAARRHGADEKPS